MTYRQLALLSALILAITGSAVSARNSEKLWAKDLATFAREDRKSPPPKEGILFLGSSSIRAWKSLETDFRGLPVFNRGFGGSIIKDSTALADRLVFPYKPRMIVFYAGDNDVAAGHSASQIVEDFAQFVDTVHAKLPGTRIVFVSIKPSPSRWKFQGVMREANERIFAMTLRNPNLDFVNVFDAMLDTNGQPRKDIFTSDMLHMNAKGYALWTALVTPHLRIQQSR
ncbi:MAG: hypothetical protein IT209_02015 [Armatimonadetes bacterium]|nr:hypothetical protein [Armatimonadota bacterium]